MRIQLFSWLLLIYLFQILRVSGQCLDDQRRLLLQLKNSLAFETKSSSKLVTWNQSVDCCSWSGVDCDNSSGQVIGLNLENEAISGGIDSSSSLFSLQYIRRLNLAFNIFNATQIPSGLQNLTNLAYLNLSNAGFVGQVPVELSTMKRLVVLDLSSLFQSAQPLKLENPNLHKLVENLNELRELHLDYVDVSSQKSEWCQALSSSLPNLTTLSLRYCGLSGPLDSSLSKLRSLSVLSLEGNNLSTTVPALFGEFSNLTTLILSSCFLRGPFPESIFKVTTLQTLDLSLNRLLSGAIPQLPINSSLRIILLGYTNFSGSLPESIRNLRMLSRIDISNCNFIGMIPPSISNLTELVYLDFSSNSFTGVLPHFYMSKSLVYLDFSRNSLTGPLTSKHFEGLSRLENIYLVNNSLSGSIPVSLFGLHSLQKLQLSKNKFNGTIDKFSISNSSLDTLDLSSNHLEGPIPDSFFTLEQLNVISLSSNFFNGSVRLENIQRLHNLTRLELGSNNLSVDMSSSSNSGLPQFPQLSRLDLSSCNLYSFPTLRNQSRMTFLDLSNNHLKGEIPSWIWNVGNGSLLHLNLSHNLLVDLQKPFSMPRFLSVLDLHSNRLQGQLPMHPESAVYVDYSNNKFQKPIPDNIFNTSYVTFFSLANNSLTGAIPASLCNTSYLQVLDLSINNLSGSIPPCLGKITSLGVLNLRRNNLSGDIPDTFPVNCSLKTLDLSNNKLAGKFPPSLANCTTLEVVNAGNNNIDDTFPCSLKIASSLRVLVLRNNNFHGVLNCSMVKGSWINLQIIDLASNHFGGKLSGCIDSWRGMRQGDDPQLRGNHLRFGFLNLNNFYYQDAITVTFKGLELDLVKILTIFTAIDLSCNNFTGVIPNTVGDLTSLYVLNISHNAFSGDIPKSIGNLRQLESLDLSANQLTGEIPQELMNLTFLSILNLSYNKLVGRIPLGRQFQTFSEESFLGNTRLCGVQLNTSCDSRAPEEKSTSSFSEIDFNWQFIFTGLGYGVGASLVLAPLVFCKQWRERCDEQLDYFLKQIIPRYDFSYIRYDTKVQAIENSDDESDDDWDDDEDDPGDGLLGGRYCVFCTKLDIQIKTVVHNSKCTCHYSPDKFSSSPTSSSSSILVTYC